MARREIKTNSGHKLSFKEAKFIEYLVAGKSELEAYHMAGFNCVNPQRQIKGLLGKAYIADELAYRLDKIKEASIASRVEILQYYSDVMRGDVKDQFGLEAPLAERTKAANELAKRIIDYERELEQIKAASHDVNITLNWAREEEKDAE